MPHKFATLIQKAAGVLQLRWDPRQACTCTVVVIGSLDTARATQHPANPSGESNHQVDLLGSMAPIIGVMSSEGTVCYLLPVLALFRCFAGAPLNGGQEGPNDRNGLFTPPCLDKP